ncbi:thioredoxin-like protein [Bimuria novae-zelandiae CBS 107.79]|uniref:Thioredoxin-like protein n=1 Tax=Bimuria novae-zelandiae CBS 107.79 TaxID=1447943 RepID=A0A6A5VWZ6_9PLEO|nr:thioredoxin-like protein [Bimuria novae-zelandiae CBS 107.79]
MSSDTSPKTTYHLYTFYASSCAARLRIALALKNISYTSHYIDMGTDAHEDPSYIALNPSAAIPTLVVETEGEPTFTFAQSVAMLEYLEETYPTRTPLLPPTADHRARARVRELMHIVTSDIFPPTNSRVAESVKAVRGERDDAVTFVRTIMNRGFTAYETYLSTYFKDAKYSCGDVVTLADVCLIPQVEQARFYKVDFGQWPLLSGVIARLEV